MIELSIDFNVVYTTTTPLIIRSAPTICANKVTYENLTEDAKKHSNDSVLNSNTRVTPLEFRIIPDYVWLKIPSGWICAIEGNKKYIK